MCGVHFPAVVRESLIFRIFSSHCPVEVSSFWWWKSSWSLWRGNFICPIINWRKLVVVAGKQMASVGCFRELYLVAEHCKRWVTFSAVYSPCRKGSAVVLCGCFSLQHFRSCVGMKLQGNTTCVLFQLQFYRHACLACSWLCCAALPGTSLVQLTAVLCHGPGRVQSRISPSQVYTQDWQDQFLIRVPKSLACQAPAK